jgi:hypothetical protein
MTPSYNLLPLLLAAGPRRALLGTCYVYGAAPFCAASCNDCRRDRSRCVNGNYQSGAACVTGYKVLCCR